MRQLNFLLFFALCLGLALFSIENTQTAAINLIPGMQIEAPLSIELLVAVGTGAMMAWIFSLWDQLQRQIDSWKAQRELKQQSRKIEELEQTLADLKLDPDLETEETSADTEESTETEEVDVQAEDTTNDDEPSDPEDKSETAADEHNDQ
ncbi:hypothetical protein Lepto7376_1232 [[Leptolyngbya] sp. PCC 7376]|uniref:LapA family protein n=1 Tax=[Leptolyngbya] sp. PCC 7376 TaxID=111781 RepID=UPI00029F4414|nr:LapA family protein [[Leptolyngbya] sp. PCC 7376]AFY37588.1 hypothetical protein Lepto7376_1232 [[Leptolyngbya] sp. PCC 7376]